MSDRPRRSTRPPKPSAIVIAQAAASSPGKSKRVSQIADPTETLKLLLDSPKSILTKIDISDVFNLGAWEMLSESSRVELSKLLPPTNRVDYKPTLDRSHPGAGTTADMEIDDGPTSSYSINPTSVFNNPHFLAAAQTFQDHLYSGWLSPNHLEKVQKFQTALKAGTLSAPSKDEAWLSENAVESRTTPGKSVVLGILAGGAAQIKLATLVKEGIIRAGDILAYRRNFTNFDITVEKDAIIQTIDKSTHALTVLTEAGPTRDLSDAALHAGPSDSSLPTRLTNITSPSMLETWLLDTDARLDKSQRPNGNAWKCFTVWRRRGEQETFAEDKRGGRENHGTLFYLRGIYYNEQ
ncbi:hypothetical protein FA15DRAFT_668021 [Coprinopsis marcescibilis]|uniref:ASX DEUBAD domain-containing protein n=1 Tax=Coprinopsis marcescibilis TaxID=230819 RepID=A0A5C3L1A1_COPMA|nr:hypothetical protein FA15DRAFT_668021 [Coprinopsis marcescibilis]